MAARAAALLAAALLGLPGGAAQQVWIAELMYHPPDASGAEIAAGFDGAKDFEYIKLAPAGGSAAELPAGAAFTQGVEYTFSDAVSLGEGGFAVVASNREGFEARYGAAAQGAGTFLCCFSGKLSNSGETLVLSDADASEIARAEYTDERTAADGGGAALALLDGRWEPVLPSPRCLWPAPWSEDAAAAPGAAAPPASVVISELHYKPPNTLVNEWRDDDRGRTCRTDFVRKRGGDLDEYLELHNPTDRDVDLAGWQLAEGVSFEFAAGAGSVIPAGGYLQLCHQPDEEDDPEACCSPLGDSCCHRYTGSLSNSGERLTLLDAEANVVERVRYHAEQPWPEAPDGYGRSLERIDASLPAGLPSSWLPSQSDGGTPGAANSVATPEAIATAGVFIADTPSVSPRQPTPTTPTTITVSLDGPALPSVTGADLVYEIAPLQGSPHRANTVPMELADGVAGQFSATLTPSGCSGGPCLLRWAVRVSLEGASQQLSLPTPLDPLPCYSIFVTDDAPPPLAGGHRMTLFGYPSAQRTGLVSGRRTLTGAVIWMAEEAQAEVFDGATVRRTKKQNLEVEFVKSNRWQGRDQLKVAVEAGVGGQGGYAGPIVEHWGYWIFANQPDSEVVTPLNEFWRVDVAGQPQQQALIVGAYDSAHMKLSGRERGGDVWKRGWYSGYFTQKNSNFDQRVLGLQEMIERLRVLRVSGPLAELAELAGVRVAAFLSFLSGNLLIANWDGYMNNYFVHGGADGLFEVCPWDLDKTSGLGSSPNNYARRQDTDMPAQFALDGNAPHDARPVNSDGIASLNKAVMSHCAFNSLFRELMPRAAAWLGGAEVAAALQASEEAMLAQVAVMEEDGVARASRRTQIANAYTGLRGFVRARSAFLLSDSGRQCTPEWCGQQPSSSTLLQTVNSISAISRSGSGESCRFVIAAARQSSHSRWGRSRGTTDCTRAGGLAAVGSGADACDCCSTGTAAATALAPTQAEAADIVCPTTPPSAAATSPAARPAAGDRHAPGSGGASACVMVGDDGSSSDLDVDEDGRIGVRDLLNLLGAFGRDGCCDAATAELCARGDVNGDCRVGVQDVLLVLAAYGRTC